MPPKQQPKKPTKKELQRELEEQRKKEEEERLKKEEELEKQRQEKLRLDEIQRQKDEEEEKIRLKEEQTEVDQMANHLKEARKEQQLIISEKVDWQKWITCDSMPDPAFEFQLTTFITEYSEIPHVRVLDINQTLNQIQYSETIIKKIMEIQMENLSVGKLDEVIKYQKYVNEIRKITNKKIEFMIAHITISAEILCEQKEEEIKKQQDSPTKYKTEDKYKNEVYQIYPLQQDIRFGMWINPNAKPGYRHQQIKFQNQNLDTGVVCDVPRNYYNQPLIMKSCQMNFDYFSDTNTYSKYRVLGGVVDIECLSYLPSQKKQQSWILKQDFEVKDANKRISFPPIEGMGTVNYDLITAVKASFTLPQNTVIYPNDQHKIAFFDTQKKEWCTNFIDDIKFEAPGKRIYFASKKLAPFAYIQDRCTDYPYISWKMRCIDNSRTKIDIEGKRDTFKFEIGPGYVILLDRKEPELKSITGVKMSCGLLLYSLAQCGINLIPMQNDALVAKLVQKNVKTEEVAIANITQATRGFFVKSSIYSSQIAEDRIICRIRENLEYDEEFQEDQEKDWKSICWYPNKVAVLKCKDSLKKFEDEKVENTKAHGSLELLLRKHDLISQQALDRMKQTQFIVLQDTVAKFLRLTHLLTFTAGKLTE